MRAGVLRLWRSGAAVEQLVGVGGQRHGRGGSRGAPAADGDGRDARGLPGRARAGHALEGVPAQRPHARPGLHPLLQ